MKTPLAEPDALDRGLKRTRRVLALCGDEIHADLRHTIRGGAVKAKQRFSHVAFAHAKSKAKRINFKRMLRGQAGKGSRRAKF